MARVRTKPAKGVDSKAVAKALAKSTGTAIDSGGLLGALIEQWGGRNRFAKDIFAEYQAGKPGSMTRQRILEMISRLTVQVTAQEIAKPRGASDMSDEELQLAAASFIQRLTNGPASAPEEGEGPPEA